jgi:hypothetical protein
MARCQCWLKLLQQELLQKNAQFASVQCVHDDATQRLRAVCPYTAPTTQLLQCKLQHYHSKCTQALEKHMQWT